MFDRLEKLIGKDKLELIKSKRIILFGLGGVGGYVCEMLIRSGIQNITIVDMDTIDTTNLNRQIIALHSSVGLYKVDVMKNRILDINPDSKVNIIKQKITPEQIKNMNLSDYDYVIDAIDDVPVKESIIKYSLENNINFISSMGTAKKLHPDLLKITTLDKTEYDPLAKKLRYDLKGYKQNKIVVLASTESPIKTNEKTLASSAFVPSTAGILIASYIINEIIR